VSPGKAIFYYTAISFEITALNIAILFDEWFLGDMA
jgi:hypothetical protein